MLQAQRWPINYVRSSEDSLYEKTGSKWRAWSRDQCLAGSLEDSQMVGPGWCAKPCQCQSPGHTTLVTKQCDKTHLLYVQMWSQVGLGGGVKLTAQLCSGGESLVKPPPLGEMKMIERQLGYGSEFGWGYSTTFARRMALIIRQTLNNLD